MPADPDGFNPSVTAGSHAEAAAQQDASWLRQFRADHVAASQDASFQLYEGYRSGRAMNQPLPACHVQISELGKERLAHRVEAATARGSEPAAPSSTVEALRLVWAPQIRRASNDRRTKMYRALALSQSIGAPRPRRAWYFDPSLSWTPAVHSLVLSEGEERSAEAPTVERPSDTNLGRSHMVA